MSIFRKLRSSQQTFGGVDGPVSSPGPNCGVVALANSSKTIPAYSQRLGIQITSDAGGTGTVYGLCGSVAQRGAVSATVWDWSITPGGSWDGQVSQAVWSGPIQLFSAGTINVGVVEA